MSLYFRKVDWVDDFGLGVVVDNELSVGYVNNARYVQKILELQGSNKYALLEVMSQPSPFPLQQYFHVLMFLKYFIQKKLVSTLHDYNTRMHLAHSVQSMIMA